MKISTIVLLAIICFSCKAKPDYLGKWYSYGDEGDYQELWIGEDRALLYLTNIDKMLLYQYVSVGDSLKFSLMESDFVSSHQFVLRIREFNEKAMLTELFGERQTDTLKTYFRIESEIDSIATYLDRNLMFRAEIMTREASGGLSHEGHNH